MSDNSGVGANNQTISFLARCPECSHEFTVRAKKEKLAHSRGLVTCKNCKCKSKIEGDGSYYLSSIVNTEPQNSAEFNFAKLIITPIIGITGFLMVVIAYRLTDMKGTWFYDTYFLIYLIPILVVLSILLLIINTDAQNEGFYSKVVYGTVFISSIVAQPFWNTYGEFQQQMDALLLSIVPVSEDIESLTESDNVTNETPSSRHLECMSSDAACPIYRALSGYPDRMEPAEDIETGMIDSDAAIKSLIEEQDESSDSKCTGNCVNGEGTYLWPNGNFYTGSWRNGKRTGQGAITFKDEYKCIGTFNQGNLVGYGFAEWFDVQKMSTNRMFCYESGNTYYRESLKIVCERLKTNSVWKDSFYMVGLTCEGIADRMKMENKSFAEIEVEINSMFAEQAS